MATPSSPLALHAKEQSTYTIYASLLDSDGSALTPNNDIKWSLVDDENNVINSRENVAYGSASSSLTITLTGNDLVIQGRSKYPEKRYLVIECTYDSDLGTGLKFKHQVEFLVDNLHKVT